MCKECCLQNEHMECLFLEVFSLCSGFCLNSWHFGFMLCDRGDFMIDKNLYQDETLQHLENLMFESNSYNEGVSYSDLIENGVLKFSFNLDKGEEVFSLN